jgi:hypothetical protein
MRWVTKAQGSFVISGLVALSIFNSCAPTDPVVKGTGKAPFMSAIKDRTIFVGEPIDFTVAAIDSEGDAVTYSLDSPPATACINSSSGRFSWRPAVTDSGERTLIFQASDGSHATTTSAKFTLIMPALADTEAVRILRPVAGDTFTYGDTLTVAFAMKLCGVQSLLSIFMPGMSALCTFGNSDAYFPKRDQVDSTDPTGRVCNFVRQFPDRSMWIGFYKLPLVDIAIDANPAGCAINFGSGMQIQDSIYLKINDPYGDQKRPQDCGSNPVNNIPTALKIGASCRFFNVAPR